VHEEIDHDIPTLGSGDFTSEEKNFSSKKPEHKSDGLFTLVVSRDGNINVLKRRVRVAKSNDWDVHVGSFTESLMINSRITDNDKSRFNEFLGDLIGKHTRSPLATGVVGVGVGGELKDSSLSISLGGNNKDILWVVNGSDDSSSNHELFPSLSNVKEMAIWLEISSLISSVSLSLYYG
jgi:hypothetical protein